MNDPPQREADNREVIDMLIAISVVARHLARKLEETNRKEKDNESDERTGDPAGRTATDRQGADRLRRESPANGCCHAAHIRSQPAGKPFPAQIPGDAAGAPTDPDADTAPETPKAPKQTRASKPRPNKTTAGSEAPAPQPAEPLEPESRNKPEEAPQYSKEEIRAMLAALADSGHREEAKALVQKYANGGSFSGIDPARYPELAEEVKQYA